jgi:hypothetical protein
MRMKSLGGVTPKKDGTVEGRILMAITADLVAMPSVAGMSARSLVQEVKGRRPGAHGDGCRTW